MTDTATTVVPRLSDESTRAHEAKVIYVTMGPQRSLEAVAQKSAKSLPLMKRWSVQFDWAATARAWDDQQAAAVSAEAAAAYRRDLEEHRERYSKAGKRLYNAAFVLLGACERAIAGTVIKGADGKDYPIPQMKITPMALAVAMRSLTVAADLEAHALRLDALLPSLGESDD